MGCSGEGTQDESMKFDPDFKGPIQKRGCTDMICCILFIAFSLVFLAVGVWAYTKGDPTILLYPTDSNGNLCGFGDYKDKPYLFFFDLIDCGRVGPAVAVMGCPTPQVCVKKCPTREFWSFFSSLAEDLADSDTDYTGTRNKMICIDGVDPTDTGEYDLNGLKDLVLEEKCAAYYLESTDLAGRCIPAFIKDALDNADEAGAFITDNLNNTVTTNLMEKGGKYLGYFYSATEYAEKAISDVRASWWMILIATAIAAVWCFIWITCLRFTAGFMVWFTFAAFIVVFALAFWYSLDKYFDMKDLPEEEGISYLTTDLDYYLNLKYTWLTLACVTGLILVIMLLIFLILRKRIKIAIALIKEAARAIAHMISVLFFPLFPFIFMVFTICYWAASAIYLASLGTADFSYVNRSSYVDDGEVVEWVDEVSSRVPCDVNETSTEGEACRFFAYGTSTYIPIAQAFQAFTMLWILNWLVALTQMTIAGSFASYYWAFKKPEDIPKMPVLNAVGRSIFYHTGTLAFGALLLTIVQVIRIALEYIERKLKGKENAAAKCLVKCLKCCFWCLEKFVKYVNKNAYTMCAIYGKNFCRSACIAFGLIFRNPLRVAAMTGVNGFICFISKLVVTAVVVFFAYIFFSGDLYNWIPLNDYSDYVKNPKLNFYLVPVIVIGLAAFIIASSFFSIFNMGVDAIFMAFLQDCEVNDGSNEKPYFMNKELMQLIGEKNEAAAEKAKKE